MIRAAFTLLLFFAVFSVAEAVNMYEIKDVSVAVTESDAAKARSKPRAVKLDPPKPRPRRPPRLITMLFGTALAITIGALLVGAAGYSAHRAKAAPQVVRTRPVTPVAVHTGAATPAKPQAQKQPKVAAPALAASTTARVP